MTETLNNSKKTHTEATKAQKEAFLDQYTDLKQRLLILSERYNQIKADAVAISATNYGHEKTAATNKKTDLSSIVAYTIETTDSIEREAEKIKSRARHIVETLRKKTADLKALAVLELFYIDGKSRQECADAFDLWHVNSFDKKRRQALNHFHVTQEDLMQ